MQKKAELDSQKKIYALISKHPGLNLSSVAEKLKMSVQLAQYHLQKLEKYDLINSIKEEGYIRYYVKGEVSLKEKKFFSLLRQKKPLEIILFLLRHPYSRHRDIMANLDISRSLLTYHLKKLIKKGIIQEQRYGGERGYIVLNDREVIRFLIKYEPYNTIEGIDKTWTDFTFY